MEEVQSTVSANIRNNCALTPLIVRQAAYRELFNGPIDDDTVHEIRASLNHELVLGRSYAKDKIEEITNRQTRLGIPGRPMIKEEGAVYIVY